MYYGIMTEVCAGSLTDVLTAGRFPVDRIELNCALELGGLTPSLATFEEAKKASSARLICMVRPRPAGFLYNGTEIRTMFLDASAFLDRGADGIVFGFLNSNHTVDRMSTLRMCELIHSHGGEAVFHKAFDLTRNADEAMEDLMECGVDRVLTSGHQPDIIQGEAELKHLQETYGSRIQILPGGGVTADNAAAFLDATHCVQLHFSAKTSLQDDGSYYASDARKIDAILQAVRHRSGISEGQASNLSGEDLAMLEEEPYEASLSPLSGDDDEYRHS